MPRGGYRAGSGRKSNAEIKTMRKVMDTVVTTDQWQDLVRNLYARAKKGDIRAAQLLISYRFGDPYAEINTEDDIQPIRIITVRQVDSKGNVIESPDERYFESRPHPEPDREVKPDPIHDYVPVDPPRVPKSPSKK